TADLPYLLNYQGTTYTIPTGAQLQVDPGVIVKWANSSVQVAGSLVVSGTAAAPVGFTSYHDASFGGKTDGTTTTPWASDSSGVVVSGGSVDVANTHVRYANCGVCTSGSGTTSSLSHVTIGNVNTGFGDTLGGSVTIADSTISPLTSNGTGVQVGTP